MPQLWLDERLQLMVGLSIVGRNAIPVNERRDAIAQIKRIFKASDIRQSVTLNFVRDDEIAVLNARWRGKEAPTDVLSFSAREGGVMPGMEDILGDIVISVDCAAAQAHEYGHALRDEISILFAHGLAHLLGYDHERSEDDAQKQLQFEMQLLQDAALQPHIALLGREISHHG